MLQWRVLGVLNILNKLVKRYGRERSRCGVRLDPASLISIPSWPAEVIISDMVSQLWGGLYESQKPDKPCIGEFLYSTVQTFFFCTRRPKDVPHCFFLTLGPLWYPLQCCFLLESCSWVSSWPTSHLLCYSDDFKAPDFAFFPISMKISGVSLLSWNGTALVGFIRQLKCFISDGHVLGTLGERPPNFMVIEIKKAYSFSFKLPLNILEWIKPFELQ